MALIADLLIAAALLAAVVIGARRGLLRSLTGLVVVVLAFVLASWAAGHRLADPVAQKLSPLVERRIEQKLTRQESASAESVLADFGFIGERLQELTQQVVRAAQESGASLLAALSQSVAHSVAYTLVYVVSFVLLLLVLGLLLKAAPARHEAPGDPRGQRRRRRCARPFVGRAGRVRGRVGAA